MKPIECKHRHPLDGNADYPYCDLFGHGSIVYLCKDDEIKPDWCMGEVRMKRGIVVSSPETCPFRERWMYGDKHYICHFSGCVHDLCIDDNNFPCGCPLDTVSE